LGCAAPTHAASQFTSPGLQAARQVAVGLRERIVVVGVEEIVELESTLATRLADARAARARRTTADFIVGFGGLGRFERLSGIWKEWKKL